MSIHGWVSKEIVMSILMAVLLNLLKEGGSVNVVMWKILEYMMLSEINPAQKGRWSLSGESHNLCGQERRMKVTRDWVAAGGMAELLAKGTRIQIDQKVKFWDVWHNWQIIVHYNGLWRNEQ